MIEVAGVVKAISCYNNMSGSDLEMSNGNLAVKIGGGGGVKGSILTL